MAQALMSTELWVLLPLRHPNARSWPESGHTFLVMSVAKFHQKKMDVIWHVEEIFCFNWQLPGEATRVGAPGSACVMLA